VTDHPDHAGRAAGEQPEAGARPLPPLRDGAVISGPGAFVQAGDLTMEGAVTLRDLTLHLTGRTRVREGAHLTLQGVHLVVSDPPGAPNGTSSLLCEGPARLHVAGCSLRAVGAAHPMWWWQGHVEMRRFATYNAELHLRHAEAILEDTRYFELDISEGSAVQARRCSAVFLSTRTAQDERIHLAGIPARRPFSARLSLGGGSSATWDDSSLEIFLIYIYGATQAHLERVERAQIALVLGDGRGAYRLPRGLLGTPDAPYVVPDQGAAATGGPRVRLVEVGVDTWDVYLSGGPGTRYSFQDSRIDEMVVGGQAQAEVAGSLLYADWLVVRDDARLWVRDSTVGALDLAEAELRPDLATSQVKVDGTARARFERVRFDCDIHAAGTSTVELVQTRAEPRSLATSEGARIIAQ
jgi:hypothetical protein